MLSVAILAGGLGTRLHPITQTIPKSLVDVAGRPFIAWQLDYLRHQGIHHVVLCLGHLGEQVEAVVGNGELYGLKVEYSSDGPSLLGTGGALKKALPLLGSTFFVMYGDSYLPLSFAAVETTFLSQFKPALMTILHNDNQWDQSNIWFINNQILEYHKHSNNPQMMHIDYGLSILSAEVLMDYPDHQAFDLAEVYHHLSLKDSLAGYEVNERFYEIGSHRGLKETIAFLEKGKLNELCTATHR